MNSSRICSASGRTAFTWATAFPATSLTCSVSGRASFALAAALVATSLTSAGSGRASFALAAALPAALPARPPAPVAASSGRYWNCSPVGSVMCLSFRLNARPLGCRSAFRLVAHCGMAGGVTEPGDGGLLRTRNRVHYLFGNIRRRFLRLRQALGRHGGYPLLRLA